MSSSVAALAFWIILMWMTKAFFGMMGAYGFGIGVLCGIVTLAYIMALVRAYEVSQTSKDLEIINLKKRLTSTLEDLSKTKEKLENVEADLIIADDRAMNRLVQAHARRAMEGK